MKEIRFFYVPDAAVVNELPAEECAHVARVLRLQSGDEIMLTDGKGTFYKALLTVASPKRCRYEVVEALPQTPAWKGRIHLAVAPTKNMDRMEWLAEKATEVGFDALTFLSTAFTERKVVKEERIDKILIAAMKQSHKAWKPELHSLCQLPDFLKSRPEKRKYVAHCYSQDDFPDLKMDKPFLFDAMGEQEDAVVLVGPEGDFSVDEVRMAVAAGFEPVSLGNSRLRTETAALVAVHLMQLKNRCS